MGDLTVLVGPNNEGKSNILQALVTGMDLIAQRPRLRRTGVGRGREEARFAGRYVWERDYPVSKQGKHSKQRTILEYTFGLTPSETSSLAAILKHNINSDLPVRLTLGGTNVPEFSVPKQRVGPLISAKRDDIADFVRSKLQLQYIPAVRSGTHAAEVVADIVARELAFLDSNSDYRKAQAQFRALETPVIARIETTLAATMREIMPEVQGVSLTLEEPFRNRARTRVELNDGELTDLALKGDGVQSLAAIALMRHYATVSGPREGLILAIEEPEVHLHSDAVHSLRSVLQEISKSQQVIITTHSPLLVNRMDIESNVLVFRNRARCATGLPELRAALGVRAADNLTSAEIVLVVEGDDDRIALTAVLSAASPPIANALESGGCVIQPVKGAGNLSYVLLGILNSLCKVHAFVDYDAAGRDAIASAQAIDLLEDADVTYARLIGKPESEFEDLLKPEVYRQTVLDLFNVDLTRSVGNKKAAKWSERARLCFESQGQTWTADTKTKVKWMVANAVQETPSEAVSSSGRGVIDGLVTALERKLDA